MIAGTPETFLLDIEGTTTPLDFVKRVLFPYAQAHVEDFLKRRFDSSDIQADLELLGLEHQRDVDQGLGPPPIDGRASSESWRSSLDYLRWLMDQDRKSTPLKSLQGKIWQEGYGRGTLKSRVFSDVPGAFRRWTQRGTRIFIYSSGSVLAQKLLFRHTELGDLTGFISGYYDTIVGPKVEAESYRTLARLLERSARDVLFCSDAPQELGAATAAGMDVVLSVRPGNPPLGGTESYPVAESFDRWP